VTLPAQQIYNPTSPTRPRFCCATSTAPRSPLLPLPPWTRARPLDPTRSTLAIASAISSPQKPPWTTLSARRRWPTHPPRTISMRVAPAPPPMATLRTHITRPRPRRRAAMPTAASRPSTAATRSSISKRMTASLYGARTSNMTSSSSSSRTTHTPSPSSQMARPVILLPISTSTPWPRAASAARFSRISCSQNAPPPSTWPWCACSSMLVA
jgi:hypothetical protein